jgi:membrane protease YdiL (CAAX protease family)
MSNIVHLALIIAIWLGIVIWLAVLVALGVFKPKRIIGPERLAPGESPRVLTIALGFALAAWSFCPFLFAIAHQALERRQHVAPTTQFSEPETVVYSGVMELVVLAAMITTTVLTRVNGLRRIGFSPDRIPKGIPIGIVAIALAFPIIIVVNLITEATLQHFGKTIPVHQLLEVLKENPSAWLRIVDVVAAGLVAPVAEEMFFRGLLQTTFRYLFNSSWPAILVAALFFAIVHSPYTWPVIFVLGVCLGYTYERTANLWASITMHASFNLMSIFFFTHSM